MDKIYYALIKKGLKTVKDLDKIDPSVKDKVLKLLAEDDD